MNRRRLPDRREQTLIQMPFRNRLYTVTFGRFADGSIAEIFIDAEKRSNEAADDARDAALAISLALQYGAPFETIRAAVTRGSDGSPAGVGGAALDAIAALEGGP